VALTEGFEGGEDRLEIAAAPGEQVFVTLRLFRIEAAFEHAGLDQGFEAAGEHVRGDAQAFFELIEAGGAETGIAQDQHAPRVADTIERAGDGAAVFSKTLPSHEEAYGGVTCIMQAEGRPFGHRRQAERISTQGVFVMSTKDTVLITGASTGIGAVYADRFAKRGHNLVLVARDFQRLETLASRLWEQYGVNVAIEPADLTNRSELERVEQLIASDPHIGVLVNNAGMAVSKPIFGSTPDDFQKLIDLNVTAATRLGIVAANAFVKRGGGAIINLSSVLGVAHEIGGAVYAGSKAFVLSFSRALHNETSARGVRVQAVLPGATRTEIWERSGRGIETLDPAILMDVHDMVDAALAGFDAGELVTIPALPDVADWQAFDAARLKLLPNLSRNAPAARYGVKAHEHAA